MSVEPALDPIDRLLTLGRQNPVEAAFQAEIRPLISLASATARTPTAMTTTRTGKPIGSHQAPGCRDQRGDVFPETGGMRSSLK